MFYVQNNDTVCQCCLKSASSDDDLKPFDANVEIGKETKKIYELFNTFGDDFGVFRECQEGSMICGECLQQLINTTNFYQKCIQTQALIRMKEDMDQRGDLVPVQNLEEEDDDDVVEIIRIPTPPVVYHEYELIGPDVEEVLVPHVIENQSFHIQCLKCIDQLTIFKSQSDFLNHLSENHQLPCILCETCGAVFCNTIDSYSHRLKHYINSDTRYDCKICSTQFPTSLALENHSAIHVKAFCCLLCFKACDNMENLGFHLHQHADQRVLACIYCPLQFRNAGLLNDHIKDVHDMRKFPCDKDNCRERFISKDLLRKHQIEKHDNREEYDCKVCKKVFDNKHSLTQHLETHLTGQKLIPVHTTANRNSNMNNNNHQRYNKNHHYKNNNYNNNNNKGNQLQNFNNKHQNNNNQRQFNQRNNHFNKNHSNNNEQGSSNNRTMTVQNNKQQQGLKKQVKRLWKGNVHSRLG